MAKTFKLLEDWMKMLWMVRLGRLDVVKVFSSQASKQAIEGIRFLYSSRFQVFNVSCVSSFDIIVTSLSFSCSLSISSVLSLEDSIPL